MFDDEHRLTAKFNVGDLQPVVTNAWGGVTKLFPVSKDPAPVVAVTAGAAKLNDRSMASLGSQFSDILQSRKQKLISVGPIARAFLKFLRKVYEQHYANSTLPEQFRDGPEFLVGGFGKQASFPELYRVKVRENTALPEFKVGETGVCWNGQSDAVERLLNGFDSSLVASIGTHISQLMQEHHNNMTEKMLQIIDDILKAGNMALPDDIDTSLPDRVESDFSWHQYRIDTDFSNLPLQEAVNLVSYLVLMQAGKARFERGVATVGGRTHIGVVTKDEGFRILNKPEISHRYTGFSDDPQ